MMNDQGRRPIVISHQSDSDDLKVNRTGKNGKKVLISFSDLATGP